MYFGNNALLNEAARPNIKDGISSTATLISHLIKFGDDNQKPKQSASWVNTILRDNEHLNQNEISADKSRTNFVKAIKDEFDGKVLSTVNEKLKEDKTGITIDHIPEKFSYDNIKDRDKVIKYMIDNLYTEEAADRLKRRGIDIPPEVYKRCKGK